MQTFIKTLVEQRYCQQLQKYLKTLALSFSGCMNTGSGWCTCLKNYKTPFLQGIKKSFHLITKMGLKPHQSFFQKFFSTNMVARGVQFFCILEGATGPLIKQ